MDDLLLKPFESREKGPSSHEILLVRPWSLFLEWALDNGLRISKLEVKARMPFLCHLGISYFFFLHIRMPHSSILDSASVVHKIKIVL